MGGCYPRRHPLSAGSSRTRPTAWGRHSLRWPMPDPLVTLSHALPSFLARVAEQPFEVPCGAGRHSMRYQPTASGRAAGALVADDHDLEAERVVLAVGGAPPPCVALLDEVARASSGALCAALGRRAGPASTAAPAALPGGGPDLAVLPVDVLRAVLVARLATEFAGAGSVVRAAVARLSLSLLAERFALTPALATRLQMAREFPRWDTGARAWTDKELVLLHRLFRTTPNDLRPQLPSVPGDEVARRTVALYLVGLLDDHRVLSKRDLAATLAPVHPNVAQLTRLLVGERLLEPVEGGYRTRPVSGDGRPRSPAGRSRPAPATPAPPRRSGRRR